MNQPTLYNNREQQTSSSVVYLYDLQFSKVFNISVNGTDIVETNRLHLTNDGRPLKLINAPIPTNTTGFWSFGDSEVDFIPAQIVHSSIERTGDGAPNATQLSIATVDIDLMRAFIIDSPGVRVKVTIVRVNIPPTDDPSVHYEGDIDFNNDCFVVQKGFISNITFQGQTVGCSILPDLFQSTAQFPRFFYQRQCNHVLYSKSCGASPISDAGAILAFNRGERRIDVNISLPAAGYWQGGFILLPDDATAGETYAIQYATGVPTFVNLYLQTWSDWIEQHIALGGATLRAYAGCDHTRGANGCAKFSNVPNFGGFDCIPVANPATAGI